MAVARARSACALGMAVTAAAKAGSDGADGGSGHGREEGWKAQGTAAAEEDSSGLRGGEEECEVVFLDTPPPPPPIYINIQRQPKSLPSKFSPF